MRSDNATASWKETLDTTAHPGERRVVPQRSAQLIVIHLGFALAGAPQAGHLVRVLDDELAVVPLPGNDVVVFFFPEQFQNEVPQLDLSRPGT